MSNPATKLIPEILELDRVALAHLDDEALVGHLLARDEGAWHELVRRYDANLRGLAAKLLSSAMRTVMPSDAVDDAIGELYLLLVEEAMRPLRTWVQTTNRRPLLEWLGLLLNGVAIDQMRAAGVRARFMRPLTRNRRGHYGIRDEERLHPGHGAAWIAAERAADVGLVEEEPMKKRRNRKSNDDT
jgi:hypothetical protein